MGCVNSKADINDTHPNIFHVINVNDRGRPVSRGKLEVTETELILHQKGKNPIKWPLRSLRKYGWDVDTDIFSIECGRRCPTGPGYYAFKCRKAEQLFNMVQLHIIGGVQDSIAAENALLGHATTPNSVDFSLMSTNSSLVRRSDTSVEGMQSVASSGGQLSPTTLSPPPAITEPPSFEHNNNKRIVENGIISPNYANLALTDTVPEESHVYMNVDSKDIANTINQNNLIEYQREMSEEVHCYANIDTRDAESIQLLQQHTVPNNDLIQMYTTNSVPCTPTYIETEYMMREVNYAELDLDAVKNDNGNYIGHNGTTTKRPQINSLQTKSTHIQKKSYATIDFPKTIALSQSINPKAELEEGSRKTRHNSTINSFSD